MPRRVPDVLRRLELRIKHGVAKPTPLYEQLRRHPPPPMPPPRKLEEIVLPTDRLEASFRARETKRRGAPPAVPIDRPDEDPATAFALKQWALMAREKLSEDEARARIEKEERELKADAVEEVEEYLERGLDTRHDRTRAELKPMEDKHMDAWLITEVLDWGWELGRFAHDAIAAREAGVEQAPEDAALAEALLKLRDHARGGPAGRDAVFALPGAEEEELQAQHRRLASRARDKDWGAWTAEDRAELEAFLGAVRVDDLRGGPPVEEFEAKRLAAFPEFEEPKVRGAADPPDIVRTLARHGFFPELSKEDLQALLDEGIEKPENKHLVENLQEELADGASHSHVRAKSAERARFEQAFLDRIYTPPPPREGQKPWSEDQVKMPEPVDFSEAAAKWRKKKIAEREAEDGP